MNKKKNPAAFVNIGSSSLLVIFLVLCLVTFATLSLSSSKSDYAFSSRLAERKTSYYEASNKAETVLGQIDAQLAKSYEKSRDSYFNGVEKDLSRLNLNVQGETVQLTTDFSTAKPTLSYDIPLNEKQSLSVTLLLPDPKKSKNTGFYQIQQWNVTSSTDWNGDNTLTLIK